MTDLELSEAIENLLVQRNLRGMAQVQEVLQKGYYLRAAAILRNCTGTVLIGTGFPVLDTFETDGPVGAIALYQALLQLGANPVIVCGKPLSQVLAPDYKVHEIAVGNPQQREQETRTALAELSPCAIVSIERPGLSAAGKYFNMRGEDISARCACFDHFLNFAECPSIAIGDGGNEIGMGNVVPALVALDIIPAVTRCDELLIADVSNWGALGLIAIIGYWQGMDLLGTLSPREILGYLSARGSVDGITRENTLTEDGLAVDEGEHVLEALRALAGFGDSK
jgi:hypothetical protein